MAKFSKSARKSGGRNEGLIEAIDKKPINKRLRAVVNIPKPDTKNNQGSDAYSIDPLQKLLGMLNTLKVEDQFYRTATKQLTDLVALIDIVGKKDPLLLAKMIVYSRCGSAGLRSINHFAAAYAARYISGNKWAKKFYSARARKENVGGTIWRMDDMEQIVAVYSHLNTGALPNAMKKGFRDALQNADTYVLLKYKNELVDIINLVHPNPEKSTADVDVDTTVLKERLRELRNASHSRAAKERYDRKLEECDGRQRLTKVKTLDAIMLGLPVSADTHEVANSEAGQIVAKAVREGRVDETEAKELLIGAKADNWTQLLKENKLGILAAIRNIRNILTNNPKAIAISLLCKLLQSSAALKNGKILPFQLDIANEIAVNEFGNDQYGRLISQALLEGYKACIPNMKDTLTGKTLIAIDQSGSMYNEGRGIYYGYKGDSSMRMSKVKPGDKALLMGATLAHGVNADVIVFGGSSKYVNYSLNTNVFELGKQWKENLGATNIPSVWELAEKEKKAYDRVVILSDYENNRGSTSSAYTSYVKNVADPYVYLIDFTLYGTTQLKGDKVRLYSGYSFDTFEDIKNAEFDANYHLEKVKAIHI